MDKLQLPPGYILLERQGDLVLAFCPDNEMSRYATWTIGYDGLMCYGNYFASPKNAAIDFELRAGKRTGTVEAS